jgi:hypothetical protein
MITLKALTYDDLSHGFYIDAETIKRRVVDRRRKGRKAPSRHPWRQYKALHKVKKQ